MSDDALAAYVSAVEQRLTRHRGREHVLSPPDFALVRRWCAGGVPLARVLDAIDRAAREGDALNSLAPLQRALSTRPPL